MKKIIRKFVILLIITFIKKIIMRKVLKMYYFVLYDGALTLKMSNMALNSFCDKTLHFEICMTEKNTTNMCHLKVQSRGGGGKDQLKYERHGNLPVRATNDSVTNHLYLVITTYTPRNYREMHFVRMALL